MGEKLAASAAVMEAHRTMVARIVGEASFEALLQLVVDECSDRSGSKGRPTMKQSRYRHLGKFLVAAHDASTLGRL